MSNLTELLAESLEVDIDEVGMDLNFKNHPRWDSLAALSLITAIEDEFGLILSDTDLKKLHTVQNLCDFVAQNAKNK